MSSILIVTENFSLGGLETHLETFCRYLNSKNNTQVFLATAKGSNISILTPYIKDVLFIDSWAPLTGENVIKNVEKLRDFIKKNSIDYVHLHPFYSFIPGSIASASLNIPYSVTIHGPYNISTNTYGSLYRYFLKFCLFKFARGIYCVSEEIKNLVRSISDLESIRLLPNPIDQEKFKPLSFNQSGFYAVVSRLDDDKFYGLKEILRYLIKYIKNRNEYKVIRIFGDGNRRQELERWVIEEFHSDSEKIIFCGASNRLHIDLNGAFMVFGMGRVILEACMMKLPSVLVGYDGVKGCVTKENIAELAKNNFSGRNAENISYDLFEMELDQYNSLILNLNELYIWTAEHYSSSFVCEEYYSYLQQDLCKQINDNKWVNGLLSVCRENLDKDILSISTLSSWIDNVYSDLSGEMKNILSFYGDLFKLQEENRNIHVQLGMTRQNLHDLNISKLELESFYENRLTELSNLIIEREKFINQIVQEKIVMGETQIIKNLENERDYLRAMINKLQEEIKSLNNKCFELSQHTLEIMNLNKYKEESKDQLELYSIQLAEYSREIQHLQSVIRMLEQTKNEIASVLHRIGNSKSFKIVHALKRLKVQFLKGSKEERKKFIKWVSSKISGKKITPDNRYNPIQELWNILQSPINVISYHDSPKEHILGSEFEKNYISRRDYYASVLNQELTSESKEIIKTIQSRQYKGIVVYPEAVNWEPVQRPQQFLIELANKGYLCFFCNPHKGDFKLEEIKPNLYLVHGEEYLLQAISSEPVIVLCTWLLQMAWAEHLNSKVIWYDLLDQLEFLSLYDEKMLEKHEELLKEADLVTYSADLLREKVAGRQDALKIPNAVRKEDFCKDHIITIPKDLAKVVKLQKPILGYYGAIEEWFDTELLFSLAEKHKDWQFVLIGKIGLEDKEKQKLLLFNNIHVLGEKSYYDLFSYARWFDVALIPFRVNELTDRVSPIKFYEYAALGLPVISTSIREMKQYKSDWVVLADSPDEWEKAITHCLQEHIKLEAKEKGEKLASQNSWKSRIEEIENVLLKNPASWKVFAYLHHKQEISVMTATFLDFEGKNFYSGGAERYLIDLDLLSRKLGKKLRIYQYGNFPWVRRFKNIEVVSLARGLHTAKILTFEAVQAFNRLFAEQVQGRTLMAIYSAFFEAFPKAVHPAIGISHGVSWDNSSNQYSNGYQFWENNLRFIEGALLCDELISVDTNTANWFQTVNYELGRKIKVIPNYVNLSEFQPRDNFEQPREKLIILYPRRLYEARGLYMTLEVIDPILEEFPNVEFHFVGKGFEEDTKHVRLKQKKWGKRVQWYSLPPEEMPKVYKMADISLIPTLYSEGTSLSCLEAMASGNAIIATRIGGLTDLVLNGYNGFLIDPNIDALYNAIRELIIDVKLLTIFKKRSIEVAKVFSKDKWLNKWKEVICKYLTDEGQTNLEESCLYEIRLPSMKSIDHSIIQLIHKLLIKGSLVYIRVKDQKANEKLSFGRIQWVGWDEEELSEPDMILVHPDLYVTGSKEVRLDENTIKSIIDY